jgi:protein TonB
MKSSLTLILFLLLGNMSHLSYAHSDKDSTKREYEFFEISKIPEFPSGQNEMIKFLSANIVYPDAALDNGIQGTVSVQFVVDKDGAITNVKVVRDSGGGLGREGERVVKLMPNWSPRY